MYLSLVYKSNSYRLFQTFKSVNFEFIIDIEFKPFGEQAGRPCVGLPAPYYYKILKF
ncbi:hypothetical protein NMT12_60008 [metagenome]